MDGEALASPSGRAPVPEATPVPVLAACCLLDAVRLRHNEKPRPLDRWRSLGVGHASVEADGVGSWGGSPARTAAGGQAERAAARAMKPNAAPWVSTR